MFYSSGWVHVICGCMFCGKTDEMLRLLRRFSIAGRRVVLIKPRLDTRTDALTVISRSGAQHTALSVEDSGGIEKLVGEADIVAIEEGQFFDEGLPEVVEPPGRWRQAGPGHRARHRLPRHPLRPDAAPDGTGRPGHQADRHLHGVRRARDPHPAADRRQPAPADSPLIVIGGMGDERYEARCRLHHEVPAAAD